MVVRDEAISEVAGGPRPPVDYGRVLNSPRGRWVASAVPPLLLLEAPQNAPIGGAFLTTLVEGEFGPQQIVWEWMPQTSAHRPPESVMLINRERPPVEASANASAGPAPQRTAFEIACHAVPWFWMTLLWNAKHAARQPGSLPMLAATIGALRDVEGFVGLEPTPLDLDPDPFRTLAALADRMDRLRPAGPALFTAVPTQVAPQARRFIALAATFANR